MKTLILKTPFSSSLSTSSSCNLLPSSPLLLFHFPCRYYSKLNSISDTLLNLDHLSDPNLFLDYVRQQSKLGFRNVDHPLSLFHQMYSLRPLPNIIYFNQLLSAMSKIKPFPPFETVATLFRQLEMSCVGLNARSLAVLANSYCHLGRVDFAFSLVPKRFKLGFLPDIVLFNVLINVLITNGLFKGAGRLFDKIVKLGFQPSIVTYNVMFKVPCRIGDYAGALDLLRDMESCGPYQPDSVIYTTLIDSLCKDQFLHQAIRLFQEMERKGVLPDVITYTCLLWGLCRFGHWKDARTLLNRMTEDNIAPDIYTYNILVDALCKDKRIETARRLFAEMEANGVQPNVVTWTSLLDGLFKNGLLGEAMTALREMVRRGVVPDIITYNCLIHGLCDAGQLAEAIDVSSAILAMGVQLNARVYNILIDGLCKKGLLTDAYGLLLEMIDDGCSPNEYTYNTIVKGFLLDKNVKKALELVSIMTSEGFQANAHNASLFADLLTDPYVCHEDKTLIQNFLFTN